MGRFIPSGRHLNRLTNHYGIIFMLSGPRWSIPEESGAAALSWGDLWDITPDSLGGFWDNTSRRQTRLHPPLFLKNWPTGALRLSPAWY